MPSFRWKRWSCQFRTAFLVATPRLGTVMDGGSARGHPAATLALRRLEPAVLGVRCPRGGMIMVGIPP